MKKQTLGHLIAFFTVFVWGLTFVSTKVLLDNFSPAEILFIRFLLGFIALFIILLLVFAFRKYCTILHVCI